MKRTTQNYYVFASQCFRNSGDPCFAFQWMFSYIGFPVELSTLYFIGAHNIPNANMNEDSPFLSVNFTSPGKSSLFCLPEMLALGMMFGTERSGYPGQGVWPCQVLKHGHSSNCTSREGRRGKLRKKTISVWRVLC